MSPPRSPWWASTFAASEELVTSDHPIQHPVPDAPVAVAVHRPTRRRHFWLLGIVAVAAYASDQISKIVALNTLADGQSRPFIGDFIRLKLIGNPGAALSLGANSTWVMTIIALGVLAAIIFVARDLGSRGWAIALGLLLGSAIGNLTDRFARPPGGGQGHVIDFLDYNRWFIGNVADIWIVTGAILIVLLSLRGIGIDGKREGARDESDEGAESTDARTNRIADASTGENIDANTQTRTADDD